MSIVNGHPSGVKFKLNKGAAHRERQLSLPRTFDSNGWLRVGYTGSQIRMSETYINTGSLYLCTAAFLPLGLSADDPFWASPYTEWTGLKAWTGKNADADHSIR